MYSLPRKSFIKNITVLAGWGILSSFRDKHFAHKRCRNNIIHLGIIGTGSRGTGLLKILSTMPSVKIVALCDIQEKNLNSALQYVEKGVRTYNNHNELLENKNIDAVVIATPHFLHSPMAMDAIESSKHVYLEKTLSYDIPESLSLVNLVRSRPDLVFQVGFQYRNFSLYHKVKEVIKEGWIGKVTHFESQYNRNSNWRIPIEDPAMEKIVNWRMYRKYCGGLLTELCAHPIDAINFITDSYPTKVAGLGSINYWKDGRDTYDNIRLVYEFENGIKSTVTSVLSNAYNGYGIRILGDLGTIEIERDRAFIYAEGKNAIRGTVDGVTGATITNKTQGDQVEIEHLRKGEKPKEPTIHALADFIDCIFNRKIPASNVETAHITSIALHMGNAAMDTETVQTWKKEYGI